ncbi:hypothetical protein A1F94_000867 [Pyrenophora tritici-repentis]|uniref:Uncharacterized protein n=2 Tax=Pyrenophora tritici-repentis TaxID=45151 RepID=A0A834S7Z5_9PLEO|nr:uncharacterized protein PTRG_01177 [Pyrenophora tritici-repentis Pt-1C-BFP]KAF7577320.1 hypothetical protein PtrM4_015600 [Pyrenophora tritici-repentis]EDU40615.1 predicted protein [Pyrenophora tritici-repentis Pt-1C-BFP]KAG9387975.1 hypothetical protein A1F94_000867 [Pyrenophora tritici-repentis]KAI1674585.1 hypothetical protein L13192_01332 [Pyrenophora tritici-repentis]KAI1688294.1 hypothetical protein KJE20_01471 [Pyrenophora tritici-repentis]
MAIANPPKPHRFFIWSTTFHPDSFAPSRLSTTDAASTGIISLPTPEHAVFMRGTQPTA